MCNYFTYSFFKKNKTYKNQQTKIGTEFVIVHTEFNLSLLRGNCMSRFKLSVIVTLFSCLFLLACATQVSANTHVLTTSTSAQPRLQQVALKKLTNNRNFKIENLQVIVNGDTIELLGSTETGFQRALAQKFLEHSQGVRHVKNNLKVSKLES